MIPQMAMLTRLARINWLLAAILAVGLVLRLWGINYGLPYTYGPDEPTYVTITLQMLKTGDMNPHWWYYPSLMFYLNAAAYVLYFLFGRILGLISLASPADLPFPEIVTMGVGRLAIPAEFLIARGMVALFSAGAIVLVYLIGRRLHPNRWVAVLAALFFAVSPTVIGLSHRFAPDILAMSFSLVSFLFIMQIVDEPRVRNYVLAGVGAGLAIASKYNAGLVLVALFAAHLAQFGIAGWRRKEIYLALVTTGLVFVIGTPFAVLDFPNFWDGVRWQAFSYTVEGHAGQEGGALIWYMGYLWGTEGIVVLGAAISAALLLIRRVKKGLVLASYPLVYFVFVSTLLIRNDRTIMLIVPFLNLLAALFVVEAYEWLVRMSLRRAVVVALFAAVVVWVVVPSLQSAVAGDLGLAQTDGREAARVWIDRNLPAGSRVAVESYSPYVDTKRFTVDGEYFMIDHPPEWYEQNGFEYLVFSYNAFGRFYADPTLYADSIARYNDFFSRFHELVQFSENGYEIRIYQTNVTGLPSQRIAAHLGVYAPMLEMVGYNRDTKPQVGEIDLTLYWRAMETHREPLRLTAHLLDRNNQEVAESSGALFDALSTDGRWPEEITRVPWKIAGTAATAPGLYRVELDVDADGIGRIPVLSNENKPISDKLFLGPIKVTPAPPSAEELQRAQPSGAQFANLFALQGYRLDETARAGESPGMTLYWKSIAKTDKDYTVFVHLIDSSGRVRAQVDAQPRGGTYPTSIWDAGEVIRDDYTLPLPRDLAPGEYTIEVGAYEYPSLTRLTVSDADGNRLGDHLILDSTVNVQ
jgi:4-amino-4-deoxy-L-arabinose transferase-like glycosyltransferase